MIKRISAILSCLLFCFFTSVYAESFNSTDFDAMNEKISGLYGFKLDEKITLSNKPNIQEESFTANYKNVWISNPELEAGVRRIQLVLHDDEVISLVAYYYPLSHKQTEDLTIDCNWVFNFLSQYFDRGSIDESKISQMEEWITYSDLIDNFNSVYFCKVDNGLLNFFAGYSNDKEFNIFNNILK